MARPPTSAQVWAEYLIGIRCNSVLTQAYVAHRYKRMEGSLEECEQHNRWLQAALAHTIWACKRLGITPSGMRLDTVGMYNSAYLYGFGFRFRRRYMVQAKLSVTCDKRGYTFMRSLLHDVNFSRTFYNITSLRAYKDILQNTLEDGRFYSSVT